MNHISLPPPSKTELLEKYHSQEDSFERALYELHRRLRLLLEQRRIRATVKYRVKSFSSYYTKIQQRKDEEPVGRELLISDVLGIRIVCPFLDDLEEVEAVLQHNFSIVEREKKGAEFSFKEFGYDSLHFLLELPDDLVESFHLQPDLLAEIQLRTILQDAWAEVEHEMVYKSQVTPFDANLRRKLAALNANLSLSDMIFHEIRVYQRELQHQLDQRRVAFMSMVQNQELGTPGDGDSSADAPLPPPSASVDSQESMLLSALQAHNANHYDTAVEIYSRIIREDPSPDIASMVFLHRGMAWFATGSYQRAREDFQSAREFTSTGERALLYLGLCSRQQGEDHEALEYFSSILKANPAHEEALLARSQLYHSIGDMTASIRDCDKLLEINADHRHGRRFREFLNDKLGI